MKAKFGTVIACASLLALTVGQTFGQYPEDALRLGQAGLGVGTRALGMGNAYTGVANDYSAIYWNPAGLAQLQFSEFSFGLSHLSAKDNSTFLGLQQTYSSNATNLNTLGLVYKIPTQRGSMAIAFGYHRQNNFASGMSFEGFNQNSSIIQSYAPNGAYYPSDLSDNLAYQLYLADIDTVSGRFISPIVGRVTQLAKVLETGGLNNWSVAGAVDIAKDLSLGVTLTFLSGTYRYDRNYTEEDRNHVYQTFPYDFNKLSLDEYIEGDISSTLGAKFGLMYRIPDHFRLGVSIKTPTTFTVKETFGSSARSTFDNGDLYPVDGAFETTGTGEYDVVTPWEFSVGSSVMLHDLMITGDIDFIDWTELKFENANADVIALNKDMKTLFRSTIDYRLGLEYDLSRVGVRLRGGFMHYQSPYQGDPTNFDRNYITGGLGFMLGPSTMLDLGYAHGWWNTYRVNYDATSRTDEKITTDTFMGTLSYRF
jgi:long-subunit fatty acid transport protein